MGAGAVKPRPGGNDCVTTVQPSTSHTHHIMSCQNCSTEFTIFKRKRQCCECGRYHCSSCVQKDPASTIGPTRRRCRKCLILLSGNFTRTDLAVFKIKDLQLFLNQKNVNTRSCKEKRDLIELILSYCNTAEYRQEQEQHRKHLQTLQERKRLNEEDEQSDSSVPSTPNLPSRGDRAQESQSGSGGHQTQTRYQPSESTPNTTGSTGASYQQKTDNTRPPPDTPDANPTGSEPEKPPDTPETKPQKANRARLEDIPDQESVQHMSVRQLREILSTNYVDYKGCVEKWELVDRVKRLWQQKVVNDVYAEELENAENSGGGTTTTTTGNIASGDSNDICKICMDAIIDCVLLECGHMVTCTQCGKQLTECPICRQYVIRVVHTFKA